MFSFSIRQVAFVPNVCQAGVSSRQSGGRRRQQRLMDHPVCTLQPRWFFSNSSEGWLIRMCVWVCVCVFGEQTKGVKSKSKHRISCPPTNTHMTQGRYISYKLYDYTLNEWIHSIRRYWKRLIFVQQISNNYETTCLNAKTNQTKTLHKIQVNYLT